MAINQCWILDRGFLFVLVRDPISVKKVKDAHRRIMIANHPDRGGVSLSVFRLSF